MGTARGGYGAGGANTGNMGGMAGLSVPMVRVPSLLPPQPSLAIIACMSADVPRSQMPSIGARAAALQGKFHQRCRHVCNHTF